MGKKFAKDCIKHYQELIKYYKQEIKQNNELIKGEEISEKKKHGFRLLNGVMEKQISECRENIGRLLEE